MDQEQKVCQADIYPVPSRRISAIMVTLQAAMIVVYVSSPFVHSPVIPWVAFAYLVWGWFLQWARWVIARYNVVHLPVFGCVDPECEASPLPPVALIAAARNEENALERAVRSMAAQDYPRLELIFINDHSTDATRQILDQLGAEMPNLCVIHDPPIQPGWMGKTNALWHGVQQTTAEQSWLLFADADIVFGPTVLRDAVAYAEQEGVDFLTIIPWIETNSFFEKLALSVSWSRHFELYPSNRLNDPKMRAIGIGAFMLVRRSKYLECGGHAAISTLACDDTALAILLKRAGTQVGFGRAGDQLRCRQYSGFDDMLRNTVRKKRVALYDRTLSFLGAIEYELIQFILPLPLAIAGVAMQFAHHTFSWGLSFVSVMALIVYFQSVLSVSIGRAICSMSRLTPLLTPLFGLMQICICASAIREGLRNTGLVWRNRAITALALALNLALSLMPNHP